MSNTFSTLTAIVFILAIIVLGPFLTIWSLNTLFPVLAIAYSFETWAATVILTGVIQSTNLGFKSRKDK